jgi:hypothetical protein
LYGFGSITLGSISDCRVFGCGGSIYCAIHNGSAIRDDGIRACVAVGRRATGIVTAGYEHQGARKQGQDHQPSVSFEHHRVLIHDIILSSLVVPK